MNDICDIDDVQTRTILFSHGILIEFNCITVDVTTFHETSSDKVTKFFIEITRNVYSIETYNEILLNTTFYFIEREIIAIVYIETCVIQICVVFVCAVWISWLKTMPSHTIYWFFSVKLFNTFSNLINHTTLILSVHNKTNLVVVRSPRINVKSIVFSKYTWYCEYTRFAFGYPSRQTESPRRMCAWHIRNTLHKFIGDTLHLCGGQKQQHICSCVRYTPICLGEFARQTATTLI